MVTTNFPSDAELASILLVIVEEYRATCAELGNRNPSFRSIEVGSGVGKGFLTKMQRIAGGDDSAGFALGTAQAVAKYVSGQDAKMRAAP